MPVGPEKEAIVRGMMSELDHWRMQLPNLTNPTCLWDLQLLSMFHYIYLMVTKDIFISFIESGVQDHYIFHVCKIHAISLHSLLKDTLPRYERFERVPGMFGQALLLGGVFRCALGLWDRNMLSLVNSNIQTLDKLKSPSKSLVNISDKLVKFIKEPRKAMEYLKSM
jgi:hypothetical protein